jgi:signal transduction histidine kinase/CheY-like chemotaxis protein
VRYRWREGASSADPALGGAPMERMEQGIAAESGVAAVGPAALAHHGVEPSFRRHLYRAMALPAVVLALGTAVLVALVLYLQTLHRAVDHADVAVARANGLLTLIAERESALRGYLLTRLASYLDRFNAVDRRLSPEFDALQDHMADAPDQVELLRAARVEVIRSRHYAAQQVDRVRDGAGPEELAVHIGEGTTMNTLARKHVREFVAREQGRRAARIRRADDVTWSALLAAVVVGLVLGAGVALATGREMRHVRQRYRAVLEERERAERALQAANVRLQAADRHKDAFLGVLSHELRNPLAPIRNSVHVLAHADPQGEQARRARQVIARQVDHLTRLVEDLLDVKRLSAGKMRLRLETLDLAEPVRETVEDLRALFVQRGIALELQAPASPLWVRGDATRLAQVVGNLLQNAAKFTDTGGHVAVVLDGRDGRVRLLVRDDGVGLPPELTESLFEPFVQGEQTLPRSAGGLGLGLALVRGIVTLHGGAVSARSQGAGRGTEFEITLPEAPAAPAPCVAAGTPAPGAGRRVLVIEDNEDAAASLRDLLEVMGGHEVEVARDGAAGLDAVDAFAPDVVVCDLGLPVLDGYEVARRLRERGAAGATTLVALSGYASAEDAERSLQAGFQHHLAKPADAGELMRIIAAAPRRARGAAPVT